MGVWILLGLFYLSLAIPFWRIMTRLGYPWWAVAMAFIPIANGVLFLALCIGRWPIPDANDYGYR